MKSSGQDINLEDELTLNHVREREYFFYLMRSGTFPSHNPHPTITALRKEYEGLPTFRTLNLKGTTFHFFLSLSFGCWPKSKDTLKCSPPCPVAPWVHVSDLHSGLKDTEFFPSLLQLPSPDNCRDSQLPCPECFPFKL